MCHSKTMSIEINDFPGGSEGFELVSRFCYNHGKIPITVSNVLLLHCCALYLEMTEEVFCNNLLQQTETFLQGIHCWTWNEILVSLKNYELFHTYADNYALLENIIGALLAKMDQNFEGNLFTSSSSSSPSSPESNCAKTFSYSTQVTSKTVKSNLANKEWWFEDLATLPPKIIEKILQTIGAYKRDNNNPILTRFLLHYLKKRPFWVLRIVSRFGMSRDCRIEIERLIGGVLEEATLDDLLVSGHHIGLCYDVTCVIRLIKQFVYMNGSDGGCVEKLKKVGRLVDKYLIEISPDQNLKVTKFLAVAECLPDCARSCFDGVYRAIDIYLQSHPMVAFEERSRLCRCLNYNKLSFEVCKDLAKNPRIPPIIAMQALISQQPNLPSTHLPIPSQNILYYHNTDSFLEDKEDIRQNLQRMEQRVQELEILCREIKVHMSSFH
ncbi:hypothetical protein ACSQ67_026385 [Phaseolus vulgaris]